jgi:predicted Zn-dependent protease
MRVRSILAGTAVCLIWLAVPASSQTSQISKKWELGRSVADQLEPFAQRIEHRDGRFEDLGYVQQTEDRVAAAAGVKPHEIRLTWGYEWYGFLLPQGVLYISVGLLERVSSEAELVGFLAHELAHAQYNLPGAATRNSSYTGERFQQCALAAGYLPVRRNARESERLATKRGIGYMKASGYDPSALLDVFSKIAYEHPPWSKAIVAEDLLSLRVALEAEVEPVDGYSIDSSGFATFHARLPAEPGHSAVECIF